MIVPNVLQRLKLRAQLEAAQLWRRRVPARQEHDVLLRRFGPGAADSPERRVRLMAREGARSFAANLMASPEGLRVVERIVGPTNDIVPLAPSEAARRAGQAVARLVLRRNQSYEPEALATGFMVTARLLLTNYHVLPSAADAVGVAANFQYERDDGGVRAGFFVDLDPGAFFASDATLDYALVAIKPDANGAAALRDLGFIKMIEATPKTSIGSPANIIQYPDGGPKAYAFADNRIVDMLDEGFIHYRTDTRPGSSGSPVYSEKWELIALHHCGIPRVEAGVVLDRNGKPWDDQRQTDDDVEWVANEGVRVSSLVDAIRRYEPEGPLQKGLVDEFLATTGDPLALVSKVSEAMASAQASGGTTGGTAMNVFNIQGPVTINVYGQGTGPGIIDRVGQPLVPAPAPVGAGLALLGREKKQNFDEDYGDRPGKGYDPDFLGITIPTPSAPQRKAELLTEADGSEWVLEYYHYSLVMNRDRRLMMWSASNVNYDKAERDDRDRGELGAENWREDPRIAEKFGESFQITDPEFYGPATRIDRGHIVRRGDNCWGGSALLIEYANADTYHFTNCTPQHEAFNREDPARTNDAQKREEYAGRKGTWGWFETFVQQGIEKIEGNKASLFAGPMLKSNDPKPKQGSAAIRKIQYPVRFWKVLAVMAAAGAAGNAAPRLMVYGFIFDQSDVIDQFGLGIKEAKASDFRNYQATLDEITKESGVEFPQVLHEHDVFAKLPTKEGIRRIRSESDVVLGV